MAMRTGHLRSSNKDRRVRTRFEKAGIKKQRQEVQG
jgi:hypothetical protein